LSGIGTNFRSAESERGASDGNPSRSRVNTIAVHYLNIPVKLAS